MWWVSYWTDYKGDPTLQTVVLRQQPHPEHPQSDPEFVLMINDTNTDLRTAALFYSQIYSQNTKKTNV